MQYTYKIIYDIKKDIWNWYDASQHSSHGFNWRNNLRDESEIKIYDQISKMNKKDAYKILEIFLKEKYVNQAEIIEKYTNNFKKELDEKFNLACEILEKITKQELFVKKYKFNLTTFPRCPYNQESGEIFFYISLDNSWTEPINNFLHEVLHFQFHHYWRDNPKSPVSKLSNEEFNYFKESLTVVLDEDLMPLIARPDRGYDMHRGFREVLHDNWKKHHDFDKLVEFGLEKLPDYIA
jgi:hypothetical protein